MKPVLDPKRDLAGATPEALARALFRPDKPREREPDAQHEEIGARETRLKYQRKK